MRRVNLGAVEAVNDDADPPGFRAATARLAQELGSDELSLNLFEIPPGEDLCPYHYEYVEEWLLVLAGEPSVRVPEGEHELGPGDLIRFPPGPEGAHRVINRSRDSVRVVMFSSSREPSVAVYPDSDKVGVWAPDSERWMFRGAEGHIEYYDGEA